MTTPDQNARRIDAIDVLRETRRLLTDQGWTQRAYARDVYGDECSANSPHADMWCLSGAMSRAATNVGKAQLSGTYIAISGELGDWTCLPQFNDCETTTLEDVLRVIDDATAKLEGGTT